MNLKHEMFWNFKPDFMTWEQYTMNLKHEMFWNFITSNHFNPSIKWTLNMKCFEIFSYFFPSISYIWWTLNMKCFEMYHKLTEWMFFHKWTLNMKCFEIKWRNWSCWRLWKMNLKHEMFWNFKVVDDKGTEVQDEP